MVQFKNEHLTVFESALYRTTCSVVQTEDFILVVDPNWLPAELIEIQEFVGSLSNKNGNRPLCLLFTHSDYDHILGYRAFPDATVIASKAFVENPDKEKNLQQAIDWDDEYYVKRDYPLVYPVVDYVVQAEGQTLAIGNTRLTFYLSPGHTADGIFTVLESVDANGSKMTGVLIAGDYLSNVEFPFIDQNSIDYEKTLLKVNEILINHKIGIMAPGHGDVAVSIEEIRERADLSLQYVRELRQSLSGGEPFDLEKWLAYYDFPISLRQAHEKNVAGVRAELMA